MRGFDVLTIASTVVLALSLVTPLGGMGVGTAAGLALLGQGLYALFHRPLRRQPPGPITGALKRIRPPRPRVRTS